MKIVIALLVVVAATAVTATESGRKDNKRILKKGGKGSSKNKAPLLAEIKSLVDDDDDDDMSDMKGWVSIEYNDDDEMVFDYHIKDGPKRCEKCKLAVMDGDACDDLGDDHYKTDENPWSYEDTPYITNKKRRAAGTFTTDNGYSYKDNECMFVVLYDEDDDDDRRVLSSNGSRRILKGKGKKGKGPKKVACGQLRPDDEDEDYCD